MDAPAYYVENTTELRYLFAFPGARVFVSRIERLSKARDVELLLRDLQHVRDARDIYFMLLAMENSLEALGEAAAAAEALGETEAYVEEALGAADASAEEALGAADAAEEEAFRQLLGYLDFFVARFSLDRSVGDEEGVRAVVEAVLRVVRAARSPRVVVANLARTALGEVQAAMARPVLLQDHGAALQVSSAHEVEQLVRDAVPRTLGVWSAVRVLDVRGVPHLSEAGNLHCALQRCAALGWRIPNLIRVGQAKRIDAHLIYINFKLKAAFNLNIARNDGTLELPVLEAIGSQAEELLRLSNEEIDLFQAEISTVSGTVFEMLVIARVCASPKQATEVRRLANRAMIIIHHIRAQRIRF